MRVVIPSVRYGDFLAVTLPAWQAFLPEADITVVTSPEDAETQAASRASGVQLHVTDVWTRDGAPFNKARALDEAFGFAGAFRRPPDPSQLCLSVDADVYPFGRLPGGQVIESGVLYGCARYMCGSSEELQDHIDGRTSRDALELIPPRTRGESAPRLNAGMPAIEAGRRALGFFQLWRSSAGVVFGSYPSAGKYDIEFRRHFSRRLGLLSVYCLHLGDLDRRNWRGRVMPRWGTPA